MLKLDIFLQRMMKGFEWGRDYVSYQKDERSFLYIRTYRRLDLSSGLCLALGHWALKYLG